MNGVALRMLLGDRAKYIGLVFGIAFSTMLMSNQVSIFTGLMLRTASQILDAREADVWVMDPRVVYVDEVEPMTDTQLDRVRGVDGVDWAVPFFKGLTIPSGDGVVEVLHGIDLDVPAGELTMLVGPSGCGKTTLISIIAGILSTTSGMVETCGKLITRMSDAKKVAFRRSAIGFVFQQYNLLPALTAAENAAIPLVAAGRKMAEAAAQAAAVLDRIGMGAHLDKLPNQLSGGQQQRVAIARAIIHAPQLIVCDEPTAALDAETGQSVLEILKEAALAPERAVIVVTHDARIFRFADRIATMEDGRIRSVQSASQRQSLEVA